ncbi:RRQRL motif-containing zinc-binding protein [Actinoplanes regularis]|uniref:Uncharacterized protein n=1 Tax=Actinoplanes regularis TaxID=52697 RepID=A0A239GTE0_9ACTN|nr:RRQRL motif-containing zinc-binding protein [Actinoplanes regularis]GIE90882.1 hypothetical protein Are01nite_73620 [Actinoplanes regularis]SNS72486.1 hypothetical protein SAMN06264365_12263 [Actinoplanes regularis]
MTTSALTSEFLDALGARTGIRVEFYDPTGTRYGFPTFPFRLAPDALATRRQLRADGLCPGGFDPVAQILWRHKKQRRIAYLYRRDLAKPKRIASPAQLAVIERMLIARRTCGTCGNTRDYYIPRSIGTCLSCAAGGHR